MALVLYMTSQSCISRHSVLQNTDSQDYLYCVRYCNVARHEISNWLFDFRRQSRPPYLASPYVQTLPSRHWMWSRASFLREAQSDVLLPPAPYKYTRADKWLRIADSHNPTNLLNKIKITLLSLVIISAKCKKTFSECKQNIGVSTFTCSLGFT